MDIILYLADEYVLDSVWASLVPLHDPVLPSLRYRQLSSNFTTIASSSQSAWPRDYFFRQILSLSIITLIGINLLYFVFAGLSYKFIFNHDMMRHPRFLPNQIMLEIRTSLNAFPMMTLLTLPWSWATPDFTDDVDQYGWTYLVLSVPLYWISRSSFPLPTPFASHAFHPVDGYLQSVPYHLFVFLFPLHRYLYLALFVFVNFWSILIHDSDMITGHPLESIINGPAHHTLHHLYFTVNYVLHMGRPRYGSYRQPESSLDPYLEVKKAS
ncbi:C5-sterol desaturase [Pisolithus microcarpus]|nr:C5-sterol desaturase [Pisolithus microcarpus]